MDWGTSVDPSIRTESLQRGSRQVRASERTRYRGRALRAGWSLWLGARQVVELQGMTG